MTSLADYEEARRKFFASTRRERSVFASFRLRLAQNNVLRRTFDATYGAVHRRTYSLPGVRHRVAPYLDAYPSVLFSPTGTGFSQAAEIQMLHRLGVVTAQDVLVVGADFGDEIDRNWARFRPRSVIGIDIGECEEAWVESRRRGGAAAEPWVQLLKMDGSDLGFRSETFDLVYSQGVLPHVVDPVKFIEDARRVLRPNGIFYAFCCPLWWTYGGSHVFALGFDHLKLEPDEFLARATELEDGSYWWLAKDLFNKLRFRDFLAILEERFDVLRVGVIESLAARSFRQDRPDEWAELIKKHDEEDLMIRLVSFTARKR